MIDEYGELPDSGEAYGNLMPHLLGEALGPAARAERRALLGTSSLVVTMVLTGLIPTKIEALGVSFSAAEQSVLLAIMAVLIVYFEIAFAFYAGFDIWRYLVMSRRNLKQAMLWLYPSGDDEREGPMLRRRTRTLSVFRTAFDLALPLAAGLVALTLVGVHEHERSLQVTEAPSIVLSEPTPVAQPKEPRDGPFAPVALAPQR